MLLKRLFLILYVIPGIVHGMELDSLKSLPLAELDKLDQLELTYQIIVRSRTDQDSVIKYSRQLLDLNTEEIPEYLYRANLYLGQAFNYKGEYYKSIDCLFKALDIANSQDDISKAVLIEGMLGSTYAKIGDLNKMRVHFEKAVHVLESNQDTTRVVTFYNNYAEGYFNNNLYDSAFKYYSRALGWAQKLSNPNYARFITGNLGMVNARLDKLDTAEVQLQQVLDLVKNDFTSLITFKTVLADVYIKQRKYKKAEGVLMDNLQLALIRDLKEQITDCFQKLSSLYESMGRYSESLDYHKKFVAYRDSLRDIETVRRIGDLRTKYEVGQKQAEVDLLNVQKRNREIFLFAVAGFAVVLLILAFIIYKYYQSKAKINRVLERQKRELESLNHTKDKFFSIISHDLRGPVSSFHGISRMIKYLVASKETDQLIEVADDIDQSVDQISALLDNLLGWAMQQQGHFPNVPEKLRLNALADDLVKTLANMAKGKGITLSVEIEGDISLWADKNMTMTILRNLVNNSLKFTPEGGSVTIRAYEDGDNARIEVVDTGVGIPEAKLKSLFRLQDKKSTYGTSGEKGLGLGLLLVYEFIEMNRGRIAVESEEGRGTAFIVMLPLFERAGAASHIHL